MRIFLRALAIGLCAGAASAQQPASADRPSVAFVNVNVLPLDADRVLAGQTIIVRGGVIAEMGPSARVRVPSGAQVIDGRGRFLMPGITDLHVHQAGPREMQLELLEMYLANGVTTILNMRGTPEHLAFRAEVAAGKVVGPRIYTVGPYVNQPFVTTPAEVDSAVRAQRAAGYDFIKLHGDLSRDAYRRLMAVSREVGIRVIGHAPRNLGLPIMFEERQYALAHAEEFLYDTTNSSREFESLRPKLRGWARSTKSAGIWLMTTFAAFKAIAGQASNLDSMLARPEMVYLPEAIRLGWGPATNPYTRRFGPQQAPGIFARYHFLEELVRVFDSTGVQLLLGTDGLNTGTIPGFSALDELQDIVGAGLSPLTALRAATINAARFLGDSNSGVVAKGKVADLVLLDANPLRDISNSRRIAGVMVRGTWLPKDQLRHMLVSPATSR